MQAAFIAECEKAGIPIFETGLGTRNAQDMAGPDITTLYNGALNELENRKMEAPSGQDDRTFKQMLNTGIRGAAPEDTQSDEEIANVARMEEDSWYAHHLHDEEHMIH